MESPATGSAHRYHSRADSGVAKTSTSCLQKRVPSADRFFTHCRPAMQPTQSYSVGGQRSSGQLTGKPAGARPDYRGRWCAVSNCKSHRIISESRDNLGPLKVDEVLTSFDNTGNVWSFKKSEMFEKAGNDNNNDDEDDETPP
ncbi:UNVERIFIED_CONTAM: hypothetical protein FKN15_010635 [Acipenser sinensis]